MRNKQYANQWGFTLLELMIVVVIIAILAAIALPSYTKYVQRTRRSDGQSALLNAQQAEEKFFFRCNRYGSMQEIYGNAAPTCTAAAAVGTPVDSPQKFYAISLNSIAAATATPAYQLWATPQGIQANDPCGILKVDNLGTKDTSGDPSFATDGDNLRCWH
jgi:type IV pilus assembly protein PilE